jgi:hypothetical protein
MHTNPNQEIAAYFKVDDSRKIGNTLAFRSLIKEYKLDGVNGYFINTENGHSYLWIIHCNGMEGFGIIDGKMGLYISRVIHHTLISNDLLHEVDTTLAVIQISWEKPTPQAVKAINELWVKIRKTLNLPPLQ